MPNTYTELRKTTVGTATSSVTLDLTSISGYTDLVLVISARGNNAGSADQVKLQVNADTGNNYSRTILFGTGSSAGSARTSSTNSILIDYVAGDTAAAGTFGLCTINLMNYSNSTTFKTILSRAGTAGDLVEANVGLWRNTAAITSIIVSPGIGTNWLTGSTFSLYGIATANAGLAKATGGTITYGGDGYIYHTFTANGTFTPNQTLSCDYLVVAGGGGGGYQQGGGGGAGGYQIGSSSLTATGYSVTIGGGGAGSSGGAGANGTNTSLASLLTSTAGGGGGGRSPNVAGNGGSGGGGGLDAARGTGTLGQGNDGGAVNGNGGGGGGGASAAGTAAPTSADGGSGGNGSTWLNGTTYAGGGGGGTFASSGGSVQANGGTGGGGGGGRGNSNGSTGTANTGSGGGGGGQVGGTLLNGSAGGSGVVIIRYQG
jgi:hypothetical protein